MIPVLSGNRQVIDQPAAPIEAADDGGNETVIRLGHEEEIGIPTELLLYLFRGIGTTHIHAVLHAFPEEPCGVVIIRITENADGKSRGHKGSITFFSVVTRSCGMKGLSRNSVAPRSMHSSRRFMPEVIT